MPKSRLPNALSALRMLLAPASLVAALAGSRPWFAGLLAAGLLTDALDGYLARRLKAESDFGRKLDSVADYVTMLIGIAGIALLWPDIMRRELPWVFAALAAFYLQIPVGHVEAGLRTDDRYNPFPEEINRRLTGRLATLHFSPTHWARDNLLAEGKAKPMIVVMPDGHPVTGTDPAARGRASQVFMEDLIGSVMPLAETTYRIDAKREMRALAGLSMGGGQTVYVGLRNLDKFAHLGVFSMGIRNEGFEKEHAAVFADPAKTNRQLKVFRIMCGKTDFLYKSAVALHETLEKGGIKHTWVESAGGHIWPNWRRYLRDFAPLLFRP